jgi:hypothetical protein
MKVVSISVLKSSAPIVFLLRPGTTAEDVLTALKLNKDFVIFPVSDPARLFDYRDELYDRVENRSRLIAASLADASRAYQRSRAYP